MRTPLPKRVVVAMWMLPLHGMCLMYPPLNLLNVQTQEAQRITNLFVKGTTAWPKGYVCALIPRPPQMVHDGGAFVIQVLF